MIAEKKIMVFISFWLNEIIMVMQIWPLLRGTRFYFFHKHTHFGIWNHRDGRIYDRFDCVTQGISMARSELFVIIVPADFPVLWGTK